MNDGQLVCSDVGYGLPGGKELLRTVDLVCVPGELVVIVGPNGAGKSTLLGLLAGDLVPTRGSVALDGKPLHAWSAGDLSRRRAVLPQHTLLQFAFSAEQVVAMGRSPWHRDRENHRDAACIDRALAATDVAHLRARSYPTLSGGEQARVNLARVLAQDTPLVLLDEPTAALDLRHQAVVMAVARDIVASGGACIAILHDLNLAAAWADRIVVLRDGTVAAQGSPHQVLRADLLSDVFEHPVTVMENPATYRPLIVPKTR